MSLSVFDAKALLTAIATAPTSGQNILAALNQAAQHMAVIVATQTSTTHDFAALQKGDLLVHIPATAGNCSFETIAVNGTKPSAAVVGDLYLQLRIFTAYNPPVVL